VTEIYYSEKRGSALIMKYIAESGVRWPEALKESIHRPLIA